MQPLTESCSRSGSCEAPTWKVAGKQLAAATLFVKRLIRRAWIAGLAGATLIVAGREESLGEPWNSEKRRDTSWGFSRSTAGFGESSPHLLSSKRSPQIDHDQCDRWRGESYL